MTKKPVAALVGAILLGVVVAGGGAKPPAGDAAGESPRSRAARGALETYQAAVRRADEQRDRAVAEARRALVKDLERVLKDTTRAGDLAEANRIDAALRAAKAGGTRPPGQPLFLGRWRLRYNNGIDWRYRFLPDGTVERHRADGQPLRSGRWTAEAGHAVVKAGDDLEHLTPAGDRLLIEHWNPAARHPREFPTVLGIAERIAERDGR